MGHVFTSHTDNSCHGAQRRISQARGATAGARLRGPPPSLRAEAAQCLLQARGSGCGDLGGESQSRVRKMLNPGLPLGVCKAALPGPVSWHRPYRLPCASSDSTLSRAQFPGAGVSADTGTVRRGKPEADARAVALRTMLGVAGRVGLACPPSWCGGGCPETVLRKLLTPPGLVGGVPADCRCS